jgi:hypothetical protein
MKTEAELNASIGKVGKADPPERAKLQFSLWPVPNTNVNPLTVIPLTPDAEGVVSVDFSFTNTFAAAAEKIDFWIEVCEACVFVKEPPNFDKPPGTMETVRHRLLLGILNPGTTFEKTTILVKPKESLNQFQIAFRYSCETCGAMSPAQAVRILLLPSPRPFMRTFQ